MKNEFYRKKWFWILMSFILILACIGGIQEKTKETNKQEDTQFIDNFKYIMKYQWNIKDAKDGIMVFDDGTKEEYKYVILGVENVEGDLQSGEYVIKTNDNPKASFVVYVVDKYYDSDLDIPNAYEGIVQGFNHSEITVKLNKGQYLYLVQHYNGQGLVYVNKK